MRKRGWKALGAVALVASVLSGCGLTGPASTARKSQGSDYNGPPQGSVTQFYTRNVVYRVDADIVVGMPDLNADVQVIRPNQPFIPANVNDFVVNIHTGHLTMDDASMAAIFNKYAFNYPGSPLTDLKITNQEGKVIMSGTLHKGLPIPFSMEGTLTGHGDGKLVLKPTSVKSAGIPVKGLMDVLGLEMANLINSKAAGVLIDGDNIVIDPSKLLPPPAINGYAVGAEVHKGQVTMLFDDQVRRPTPDLPENAQNFILMWGGNILINNHVIMDAKLEEIDLTPQDPMFFYMPVYREQLAAGFVVADHGFTIAYLPDVHGTTVDAPRYRPKLQ